MGYAEGSRLDSALASSGLARSRNHAAQLIADGFVSVDGVVVVKPSAKVFGGQALRVEGSDHYVSRGAGKLLAALDAFDGVVVAGRVALDAGASTGGFTQVLLERGARLVLAVDVGHDQLSPVVSTDARVRVIEGYNVRHATPESLAGVSGVSESPALVVADLSFISLTTVLPALVAVAAPGADFVLLIKPQFEVGRTGIREGVVRNAGLRADAITTVLWAAFDLGLGTAGLLSSPVIGTAGNHEYLVWLSSSAGTNPTEWLDRALSLSGAQTS
ncbi:TlyA family RNA methyltransferase [Subtercola boreus]|uniref:TlyA family rRNA (Cytidine-2'-O)-methyltransferase n=1 Tax=Subtercola boreus TaxID=120213 RepID=A0A3E0WDA7_9MICO|nr:TlyA family RNA methyltransferase [Subtercola boreus]RFA21337.1 TlyA family rRNA (cytidine-2'-O)-methyltransferase [Subtercola boreus]RFA21719.1 TlyA family rRNA (cytidine-2'-O)-methyltransferase [Subtercola boreus]RFA27688.1 TlyA family rRNA (cytidine-2'-O)-methyltransferase [Subtercola boreus]